MAAAAEPDAQLDAERDDVKASTRPVLDWRTRTAMWAGTMVLRVLGATWRVRVSGREALLARDARAPRVVYTLWHGQMLPILFAHRQRTGVLISEHRDGEIIAGVVSAFGFFGIRGSTTRGGARALLACVRALHDGADVAITPDGPRGPIHSYAPGALVVAFRARADVVSIVAHVDRCWRLSSWDAFVIPKPFARITIRYGAPMTLTAADVREASAQTSHFAALMHGEVAAAARDAANVTHWSA
ncbi:MAG: lysophospholipid acyltransferase family protein [Gemmatimonadaceae bacterium]|nr:lysophospholipid acyltransferase family protein [Gemmatimonadaceae bacterium]